MHSALFVSFIVQNQVFSKLLTFFSSINTSLVFLQEADLSIESYGKFMHRKFFVEQKKHSQKGARFFIFQ